MKFFFDLSIGILVFLFLLSVFVIPVRGLIFWLFPKLKESWLFKPTFIRNMVIYQFIGLGLLGIIIMASYNTPIMLTSSITPIMQLEDRVVDEMMRFNYKMGVNEETSVGEKIPSFVLLDIDNKTHSNWEKDIAPNRLDHTPLDKLKNLIEVAVRAEARLIIVDIDLSYYQEMNSGPYVKEFIAYLKKHANECKINESECSRIILVHSLSGEPQQINIGVFENVVTKLYPYIQLGTSKWFFSTNDNVKRRWSLWEIVCTKKQPKIIPSITLLATSIIREKECTEDKKNVCNIQDILNQLEPQTCNQEIAQVEPVNFYNFTLNLTSKSIQQRIMYRLPYDEPVYDKKNFPISTILSARPYANKLPKDSSEIFPNGAKSFPKKSVVVIGASFVASGISSDIHETPIGDMPGALLISNAIYSLLQELTIKPVSSWWLVMILVVILSLFSLSNKLLYEWLFVVPSVLGLFYYSAVLLKNGTWLSVVIIALPIIIIVYNNSIYKTVNSFYKAAFEKIVSLFNWWRKR